MKKITPVESLSHSAEIVIDNIEQLRALFPEAITEGKIDFDVLRQVLGDVVDEREEKYGLNWHGKRKARQLALTPSTGTLRPYPDESVDWDTTQNLMIEGDNLEVLKLLQRSYTGKVKLIYIDPPYNTGKDFVYPDNYQDNIKNYLEITGQVGDGGSRITSNTETSGRFHTDWLNMMYPRLKLARNLLCDEGIMCISISDIEIANLLALCNDIFGETNHLATFIAVNEGNLDNQSRIKVNHEYVVVFAKNETLIGAPPIVDPNIPKTSKIFREEISNTVVQNGPGNPISTIELPVGFPADFDEGLVEPKEDFWPRLSGSVKVEAGKTLNTVSVTSGWKCKSLFEEFIGNEFNPIVDGKEQQTVFCLSKTGAVFYKKRRVEQPSHVLTVLRGFGTVQAASAKLERLGIAFSYPKPTALIGYFIKAWTSFGDIVLDFFAGSGTTGEATFELGSDQGGRRFVLVQLPEPTNQTDFPTIADICKERLRRSAKLLSLENPMFAGDLGFRVFKLDASNIQTWDPDPENLEQSLLDAQDHLKADRSEEDVLYELLLKLGLDLCVPIERREIAGKSVHSIGAGVLLVCIAEEISRDDVEALAHGMIALHKELAPSVETTIVFRDSGFQHNKKSDDVAKTNITEILKQHGLKNVRSL